LVADHPSHAMTAHPPIGDHGPVAASHPRRNRVRQQLESASLAVVLDAALAAQIGWREHAAAVADAYLEWSVASPAEEPLRFTAYIAALDREENAAGAYARSLVELERCGLPGGWDR
jgi:hypothetical protein